ncbi:DUF58 domain-containing protein [Candidatus Woesearchaeota archaeon]|nr:MAG: DUF58 domain-containing protein [Candidatus Woesearchaeota archaeon]
MKDVVKQIKKVDIVTKKLVDSIVAGNYYSLFKGQGIEFSEIREYKPNDDVRAIDWNVTARYNKPYIKEFIEERDLRVYFAIDCSASNNFGNVVEKKKKAIEIVASLMFSAVKNNDNVGLILFTEDVELFVPARKGKKHALKMIKHMLEYQPMHKTTNLATSFSHISKILKRRSFVFIVSDFFDEGYVKYVAFLKKRHDVVAIKVNDVRETELPDVGLIQLEDEETGEQVLVDTSDEEFRQSYMDFVNEQEKEFDRTFKKNKIDCIKVMTHEDYGVTLKKFFKMRGRK